MITQFLANKIPVRLQALAKLGRGVGLPYCRPFLAKLHYIEFWVTSYNTGGWPLKQFFLKMFAVESITFYR